ncbi:MAG: hypothetical protein CBC55_03855 [Gammaproteobacteria bacterium TMED95]|nr:MAG: hypothetical protein CBC55_03855 [Gammaproteobacteria bacterium TMED95]
MIHTLEQTLESLHSQVYELETYKTDVEWKINEVAEAMKDRMKTRADEEAAAIMEEMPYELESIFAATDLEDELSEEIIEELKREM